MDSRSTNQRSNGKLPTSVWSSRTLIAALLLGAVAVHATAPQKVPTEQRVVKPYGSGYEARGLGAPQVLPVDAEAANVRSTMPPRTGHAGSTDHSGGGAGGSGRK